MMLSGFSIGLAVGSMAGLGTGIGIAMWATGSALFVLSLAFRAASDRSAA